MSHTFNTRTARRGGNNSLQVARRQQGTLVSWIGISVVVLAAASVVAVSDVSNAAQIAAQIVATLTVICIAALVCRVIRLEGRVNTIYAEQRAASRTAAQRRSVR